MKSLVRPENDGNVVLSNVLEEEASFDDVDLYEAIEDKTTTFEVRGTCGWRVHSRRLQTNLTLVQGAGLASSYFLTCWI